MFSYSLRRVQGEVVLAACDSELLGKTFREGEAVLTVSEAYYGGDTCDERTLVSLLNESTIAGLVGERAVSVAVKIGYAEWAHVKRVSGVPHVNIYKI